MQTKEQDLKKKKKPQLSFYEAFFFFSHATKSVFFFLKFCGVKMQKRFRIQKIIMALFDGFCGFISFLLKTMENVN